MRAPGEAALAWAPACTSWPTSGPLACASTAMAVSPPSAAAFLAAAFFAACMGPCVLAHKGAEGGGASEDCKPSSTCSYSSCLQILAASWLVMKPPRIVRRGVRRGKCGIHTGIGANKSIFPSFLVGAAERRC